MQLNNYGNTENSNIEFKEKVEIKRPKSWLKSVSAFANTNGGTILFGVRDKDREAVGLENVILESEKISKLINQKISPLPRYELNTFVENKKDFIEVKIGDGPRTPYYYDSDGRKEVYIRAGNETIIAPKHILENLILKGQNTTFDELSSKYNIRDVSFTLLAATLKKETRKELNQNKDFISLELITENGNITNAGLLLSDQGLFPQSRIFCTRWKGLIKGSINGDVLDDKEYTGSIISLLENAETFIKNNSKVSWEIMGMKRVEKKDYPIRAVREAIVNAIVHRDYQIVGSEIHIDMFDDRLEITSPGGMIDGTFVQELDITKISSMRRNRNISDIFNRLHFMERRGSGLTRIIESYNNCDVKPSFISDASSFKVIFPSKRYIEEKNENKLNAKSPVKAGTKSPVKEGEKSPVKAGTKSPANDLIEIVDIKGKNLINSIENPVKINTKSPVKEGAKSPVKEGAKSPVKEDKIKLNENEDFIIKMYKILPLKTRENTYEQIKKIFTTYSYKYSFKREDIEELLGIKKSRASEIISVLLDSKLISYIGNSRYKFKK